MWPRQTWHRIRIRRGQVAVASRASITQDLGRSNQPLTLLSTEVCSIFLCNLFTFYSQYMSNPELFIHGWIFYWSDLNPLSDSQTAPCHELSGSRQESTIIPRTSLLDLRWLGSATLPVPLSTVPSPSSQSPSSTSKSMNILLASCKSRTTRNQLLKSLLVFSSPMFLNRSNSSVGNNSQHQTHSLRKASETEDPPGHGLSLINLYTPNDYPDIY